MNCTTASLLHHKEGDKQSRKAVQQEKGGQGKIIFLVSACLLGENCKYSGGSNRNEDVILWKNRLEREKRAEFIPICPEVMGGLPTPRVPAEINGARVITRDGRDVTAEYREGAEKALMLAKQYGCQAAVLKERSPSCGSGAVYDGTFSGILTEGDGITASLLKAHGVIVVGESQAKKLLEQLQI